MDSLGFPTSQTRPTEPGQEGAIVVRVDGHGFRTGESWQFLDGKWLDDGEARTHKFLKSL